ncbi:hypothetical protein [Pseudomonas sp. R9.37]|uniref:hypothetical protein n=1 Tax=Pseudomonas sp. R9.37 TaxID=1390498 RepID=UPI0011B1E70A|nr:hypothetical protein [Pseudomonas sp. R9.37]
MPPLNWRLSIEGWPTLIVDAVGAILGANADAVPRHSLGVVPEVAVAPAALLDAAACLIFRKQCAFQDCYRAVAGPSDTVFSLLSASVSKTPGSGQWRHPDIPVVPLPFGGLMTKMALFLFGFLVLTIGIGLLATISPV